MRITYLLSLPIACLSLNNANASRAQRPNILCITCEDISPRLGCYGDKMAVTPNLDKFAETAIRYTGMYTTVGVSSPSRAALITGMYPTAIGANYMRNFTKPEAMPEGISPYQVVLPEGIKCYTEYLRAAGYYCTNNVKTDYQFESPLTAWDECSNKAHWRNRPDGMPFFSIFNLTVTHESQVWKRTDKPLAVNPDELIVPPYFPDDAVIRHDMAVMYSMIAEMDKQFKKLIDELKTSGEYDNTIIIWYSDNGGPLPREKRAIYETGTNVPFMVSFPNGYRSGDIDNNLYMFPDIPATILSLAGINPPEYMQGKAFLGEYAVKEKRRYVYGARDRMDEQVNKQGAVRDRNFRYVRNYTRGISNYRPNAFRLQMPMMRRMVELLQRDSLGAEQMRWFAGPCADEEFYDLKNDPYELHNLIADPRYQEDIARLRREHVRWVEQECPQWKETELENKERMWPNGKQPVLRIPTYEKTGEGIVLKSEDKGVSFAYQINGHGIDGRKNHWFLFDEPIKIGKGDRLTFVAVRAGMKNSETVNVIF